VVDGHLITGQNPASSESTARALLKELEARLGATTGSGSQR
jgi:putative intracellular protease/amidase